MTEKQHDKARKRSGRKLLHPEGETVAVTSKVPLILVKSLDALAEKKEWTRSGAITEAVRLLLKHYERRTEVTIRSAEAGPSDRA